MCFLPKVTSKQTKKNFIHTTTNNSLKNGCFCTETVQKQKIVTPSREGNIYNSLYILQHCFLPDCFPCIEERSCLTPTHHQACIGVLATPRSFFYILIRFASSKHYFSSFFLALNFPIHLRPHSLVLFGRILPPPPRTS